MQARIGIAASTLAGLSVVGLMVANTASASTRLGGVDMNRACHDQYYNPYGPTTAVVLDQHNAYSWVCKSNWNAVILGEISVNKACATQYPGSPPAYAGLAVPPIPTPGTASAE